MTNAATKRTTRRREPDERQARGVDEAAGEHERPAADPHGERAGQRLRRHERERADQQDEAEAGVGEVVLALEVGQARREARERRAVGGEDRRDGRPRAQRYAEACVRWAAAMRSSTARSSPARSSAIGSGSPLTIDSKNALRSW